MKTKKPGRFHDPGFGRTCFENGKIMGCLSHVVKRKITPGYGERPCASLTYWRGSTRPSATNAGSSRLIAMFSSVSRRSLTSRMAR